MGVALMLLAAGPALARKLMPVAAGTVNLPFQVPDNAGNTWMIYQNGWLQQQGNQPLYSQGAMLTINGQQPNALQNTARIEEKTGELVFENMQAAALIVTRRISFDREEGSVRYIDIIKNPQGQDVQTTVMIQTNLNFGINRAEYVADPKKKDQNLAWVAETGAGRSVVEVFAGAGCKQPVTINWPQGNNYVQASFPLTIPAGKEVAIMHLHFTTQNVQQGQEWVLALKTAQLLKEVDPELRKLIVNFPGGQGFIGEIELLRGDVLDVVELRGGDQVKGTIKEQTFKLSAQYGKVELEAGKIVGMINVGQFRPRQLLVTTQGEIFGGQLEKDSIELLLSSGQTTQIPLSQITRFGTRNRANEPEEWTFEKPMVVLRSGDRMEIVLPESDLEFATRYGQLKLSPGAIGAIVFESEEHGVHEIVLKDGSHFAGLMTAEVLDLKLAGVAGNPVVKLPGSALSRLQLTPAAEDGINTDAPTMSLVNNDQLVGEIAGQLKLATAFDTLTINGGEIKGMARTQAGPTDVQITLWDGTTVSGQLEAGEVTVSLRSGASIRVPVTLIASYENPLPQPSTPMVEQIRMLVEQLNHEDWKQRDQSQQQLIEMGVAVAGVLTEMRPTQPPEAQQRIDQIIAAVKPQ